MIAAPHGRSGKTVVTVGLCSAFRKRGLLVQPFKKGPDYIDPSWLSAAAGRDCRNLDTFLMGSGNVARNFEEGKKGSDVALIEGNMGLFDGIDGEGTGSSAQLARLLGTPVLLVIDTARMSRSVAALVKGCQVFEPDTPIMGVILNNVAGERHKAKVIDAVERYCGTPVLGAIPRNEGLRITERHLGLVPFGEDVSALSLIDDIGEMIKRYLDLDRIAGSVLETGQRSPGRPAELSRYGNYQAPAPRIGVFRDKVFSFYYPENLEALTRAGAHPVFVDSLQSPVLPAVDGLYIGGGFPEFYPEELAGNRSLMDDVARAVEGGLPVYAECAGLMYLTRGIRAGGKLHRMAGIIPAEVELCSRPQGHGYVEADVTRENPFYTVGTTIRGHEFHHSRLTATAGLECSLSVTRGHGIDGKVDGVIHKNLFASYTHIHAYGVPEWADAFVSAAARQEKQPLGEGDQREERRSYGTLSGM
jgi:cobyrinic acid a,c-diamide synthase